MSCVGAGQGRPWPCGSGDCSQRAAVFRLRPAGQALPGGVRGSQHRAGAREDERGGLASGLGCKHTHNSVLIEDIFIEMYRHIYSAPIGAFKCNLSSSKEIMRDRRTKGVTNWLLENRRSHLREVALPMKASS